MKEQLSNMPNSVSPKNGMNKLKRLLSTLCQLLFEASKIKFVKLNFDEFDVNEKHSALYPS